MPNHKDLTGDELHEPKGVDRASPGAAYLADGEGSGNWIVKEGWLYAKDSRDTNASPALTLNPDEKTRYVCNGMGLTKDNSPSDALASLWNFVDNNISPIQLQDTYLIEVRFKAEEYSSNSSLKLEIEVGDEEEPLILLNEDAHLYRTTSQSLVRSWLVYCTPEMLENSATIYLTYEGTGTCNIYGNEVMIERISKGI